MKFLSWVHRKVRREAAHGDPHVCRDPVDGGRQRCTRFCSQTSPEELHRDCQHHPTPLTSAPRRRSFLEDDYCRETWPEEHLLQPRAGEEMLLQGLLAIGTLGLGPSLEGPPPLQLLCLFDSILAEKEQPEVTEDGMKATVAKLEEASVPDLGDDKSSRLPSPAQACGGTTSVSAGEEGRGRGGGGGEEERRARTRERTVAGMVKKVLKQRRGSKAGDAATGGSSAAPPAGGHPGGTSTSESTFCKILKMIHRKVHPEGSTARKKRKPPPSNTHVSAAYPGGGGGGGEGIGSSTRAPRQEGTPCCFRCRTHPSVPRESFSSCGGDSNGSREHWIKTDKDYLVLEL